MALPLDDTLTEGDTGHVEAHETIATVLNALLPALGMSVDVVETMPRWAAIGTSAVPTSGTLYLAYFTPLVNKTISNISVASTSLGASSGLTLARVGLYTAAANGDVTLVARSASNTSILSSLWTVYTEALDTTGGYPASYALVAGTRYAVGLLQVGTTPGRFYCGGGMGGSSTVGTVAPFLSARKAGLSDIDANVSSVSSIDLQTLGATLWARLS